MQLNVINETLIEYRFADTISLKLSERILSICHYLMESVDFQALSLIKITPGFTAIAISFTSDSPLFNHADFLREDIIRAGQQPIKTNEQCHTIEIIYDGLDLQMVCQTLQLTKKQFIQLHQQNVYTIAMLGFKGNFPYLLGLDKRLVLPRRASPRNQVKKGSVAIAAEQCGIYTEDSPGGWHIIAHTDFTAFASLAAGERIVFKEKYVN